MATGKVILPSAEQMAELLDSIKEELQVSVGNTFQTATPASELKLSEVIDSAVYGQLVVPLSVGFNDGNVYGSSKDAKRLVRVSNSFETKTSNGDLEYGQDFTGSAEFTGTITHVEKTYAGFIVIETIQSPNRSNVWFSTKFDSGFTKVLSMDRGRVAGHNFSAYHSGTPYNNVMMVSEYIQNAGNHVPGQECRLFLSTDGGQTWKLIRTLKPGTNNAYNNHMHSQVYDPFDARIYSSNGDHNDHAELVYSDDLGSTWKTIPLSTYTSKYPSHHPQPTTMIATPNKIITSHDNGLPGGILSLIKDKKYTLLNSEQFTWKFEYAAYPAMSGASGKYAFNHVKRGKEIYVLIPSWPGHKQVHIIGSGDNGNTWHNVASLNLTGDTHIVEAKTLIGVDSKGFMYVQFSGTKIAKFKTAEWIYS